MCYPGRCDPLLNRNLISARENRFLFHLRIPMHVQPVPIWLILYLTGPERPRYATRFITSTELPTPPLLIPPARATAPPYFAPTFLLSPSFPFPLLFFPPFNISKCPAFSAKFRSIFDVSPAECFCNSPTRPVISCRCMYTGGKVGVDVCVCGGTKIRYLCHAPLLHQRGFLGRDGAGAFFGAEHRGAGEGEAVLATGGWRAMGRGRTVVMGRPLWTF